MRLKQINLAGFKSFVDLTKIPFQQQMTAIVGPNGCGKSNIIDAVRWVLGESSAKNLRGDTMTDVIFNGAASRKPIGQASVELIFDNSQNKVAGSLADRNQISIRRLVNRDSTNTYYLNSVKCRRKDITDIFLGTGLGPRSYAIIEQGTISRLIESKPQDLRVFIEEAAGISKYKERRRETETRIRHTRENLARLADIRSELTLQVDKLHQQAEAAKRFRTLKSSERKYKAELSVFRWQQFTNKSNAILQQVEKAKLDIKTLTDSEKQNDISLFQIKQQTELEGDSFTQLQQEKLTLTQQIAKVEQSIKYAQQQEVQLKQEVAQNEQQYSTLQSLANSIKDEQELANILLEKELPKLVSVEESINAVEQDLSNAMAKQEAWQLRWIEYNKAQTEQQKKRSAVNVLISAQKSTLAAKNDRKQQLEQLIRENQQNDQSAEALEQIDNALQKANKVLSLTSSGKDLLDTKIKHLEKELAKEAKQHSQQLGKKEALVQQFTQLSDKHSQQPDWAVKQSQWLQEANKDSISLFHQQLEVDEKWRDACEQVLWSWLQAQVVNDLPNEIPLDTVLLVSHLIPDTDVISKVGTLAEKFNKPHVFTPYLNQIYLAENLSHAKQVLPTLLPHESVICPDTTWLGHGYVRKGAVIPFNHLLNSAAELNNINEEIDTIEQHLAKSKLLTADTTKQLEQLLLEQSSLVLQVTDQQVDKQQLEKKYALALQQVEQNEKQNQLLLTQLVDIDKEILEEQAGYAKSLEQESLLNKVTVDDNENAELNRERDKINHDVQRCQQKTQTLNNERHQLVLIVEQAKHKKSLADAQSVKTNEQMIALLEGQQAKQEQIKQLLTPLDEDKQNLQRWLATNSQVDDKLENIHKDQSVSALKVKEFEIIKKQNTKEIERLNQQINQQNLEAQNFKLRAEASLEQLKEMQQDVEDVQANMKEEVNEGVWQAHIIRIAKDINRLGPINLAAISEYEKALDRLNHLEQQNDDLTLAISTLESAIAKIDKESRQKFQITFDKVNNDLKLLFPKVFGGGSAYLELTGEDLLDTGVTIMARPPGKKNSTIHLLSGGEKALTALSLVFAIFRLNPAPFCMLDEVDAPLDDANVERFCNLVREMSQTVQFIYISHNKIAMEMASHLTGVTMFEPGVSRMVAVDIDEAVAMAENT